MHIALTTNSTPMQGLRFSVEDKSACGLVFFLIDKSRG